MPLTAYQARLAKLLATNRSPDSYLAGGAAIHIEPNSKRYSNDLDYFNDSVERVTEAFASDEQLLEQKGYDISVDLQQPGYIRAVVSKNQEATKIEWAHDSAWRFLPTIEDNIVGYRLHPIDLAINKVLALVGRDEPRDFLDTLHVHEHVLPLGALCWAAAGKDPGYTPRSLLELLRRRGKYQPEDFSRLHLAQAISLPDLKQRWLSALDDSDQFIQSRPMQEVGCLYYDTVTCKFVAPKYDMKSIVAHYGRPGGILPSINP